MEKGRREEIEQIISEFKCPKDFKCYRSGLETLCRAKDVGIESFLLCLEQDPQKCRFSLRLETQYLCECPLRNYIARRFKK